MTMQKANRFMMLIIILLALVTIMEAAAASLFIHYSGDTMISNKTITDGQTLISSGRKFEMGFFSPGESSGRYLGIWFYNISVQTVAWVANRAAPLNSSDSGTLHLSPDGNLVLSNRHGRPFWSTNTSIKGTIPALRLLDSGNLVLSSTAQGSNASILWQSFDHQGDTFLSGMKIGMDYQHNILWQLTSWRSPSDPSPGDYCYKYSGYDVPESYIWRGSQKIARFYGPWVWPKFAGFGSIYKIEFFRNAYGNYYTAQVVSNSLTGRVLLNSTGSLQLLLWSPSSNEWTMYVELPSDICDKYAICGPNGICDPSYSSICRCLQGFTPRSPDNWNKGNYTDGCMRDADLKCSSSDSFTLLHNMKTPDTEAATSDEHKNLNECREWCIRNCSCTAYAVLRITGCVIWHGDLYDIKVNSEMGNDLYLRLIFSKFDSMEVNSTNKRSLMIIILTSTFGILLAFVGLLLCFTKRTRQNKGGMTKDDDDELELPIYDFETICAATDNFSTRNMLGQGGFGLVYKGTLIEGQEIAVKRLSRTSIQGSDEFKNEVTLIAKLQHRNLVRLLGYSVAGEERILVYEYMPNKSLDTILFEKDEAFQLSWQTRYSIIKGIARGLVYLHEDSRFRIIHRDLKASNILLDNELKPKISDFGVARIFSNDDAMNITRKVVGTYGYMSPEYAMNGLFSVKSDVFSFGVLVLEIISGVRNKGVYHSNPKDFLLGKAWSLWNDGRSLELIDPLISEEYSVTEVMRCIKVGLLSVQELPEDRPTMSQVVMMLVSDNMILPQPKQPDFLVKRSDMDSQPSSDKQEYDSTNYVTLTIPVGR